MNDVQRRDNSPVARRSNGELATRNNFGAHDALTLGQVGWENNAAVLYDAHRKRTQTISPDGTVTVSDEISTHLETRSYEPKPTVVFVEAKAEEKPSSGGGEILVFSLIMFFVVVVMMVVIASGQR